MDSMNIYCDLKGKIRPRTDHEDPGEGGGVVVKTTPRLLHLRARDRVMIEQEHG